MTLDEQDVVSEQLNQIVGPVSSLIRAGWRIPHEEHDRGKLLYILEAVSTGVHEGYCDDLGFWIAEDGGCPTWPLLVKDRSDESCR